MKKWHLLFYLLVLFTSSNFIIAQSIWTNNITGSSTANPYTSGDVTDPGITVSGIGAAGITLASTAGSYGGSSWGTTATIDVTNYFSFTINPGTCSIDFTSFVYTSTKGTGGPTSFAIRSSVDGYVANIGTPTATGTTISLSAAAYQNITSPITFRFYAWNATGSTATFNINSFTFNGVVTCTCPQLTGIITDGCDAGATPCDEGQTEVMFFNTGSYSITVSGFTTKTVNYYGSQTVFNSGTPNNYTGDIYVAPNSTITALNANSGITGCASSFTTAAVVPAHATVMMVACDFCHTNYDFSAICSLKPIYVLLYGTSNCKNGSTSSGDGLWLTGGNFANHQSGTTNPKFIMVDFSSVVPGCNQQYYTYDASNETNSDGAGVAYPGTVSTNSASPTNQYTYTTTGTGCKLPIVLPIQLTDFVAYKINGNINLTWTTFSETNNDYFIVEYSSDGTNFNSYAEIKGAGTTNLRNEYSCIFKDQVANNSPYFRLKQVDYNGDYKYSSIITLNQSLIDLSSVTSYYNSDKQKIIVDFQLNTPKEVSIMMLDVTGTKINEVATQLYSEGNNEVLMFKPDKPGIYILVYQSGNSTAIRKKIIVTD